MFGKRNPFIAQTSNRAILRALGPDVFSECCRALLALDKSPTKDPSVHIKPIWDQRLCQQDAQVVFGKTVVRGEIEEKVVFTGGTRIRWGGEVCSFSSVATKQYRCIIIRG